MQAIDRWMTEVRDGEDAQVLESFRTRAELKDKRVRVDWGVGFLEGSAAGIDSEGRLLIQTSSGLRPLQAGTVTLL